MRGSWIKEFVQQDLILWPLAQKQLALDDDTFKELVDMMIQSEIINCEIYIHRALVQSDVTVNYDVNKQYIKQLYLPMPIKTDFEIADITIMADDTEITDYEIVHFGTGIVKFPEEIKPDTITITYTPQVYEHREALIPGILMKVTEYFTNRENTGHSRNNLDPATNIYNRHRIKTSL